MHVLQLSNEGAQSAQGQLVSPTPRWFTDNDDDDHDYQYYYDGHDELNVPVSRLPVPRTFPLFGGIGMVIVMSRGTKDCPEQNGSERNFTRQSLRIRLGQIFGDGDDDDKPTMKMTAVAKN